MVMNDFSTRNAGNVVFSEPHGTTFADVDGDGIPDFIVGNRSRISDSISTISKVRATTTGLHW
jgi:hypothetical protein